MEAQSKAKHDEDESDGWVEQSESDDFEELENELQRDEDVSDQNSEGQAPKQSFTDKMQNYESDDNDIMAQLHKLDAQDTQFKVKVMKANKNDDQKAEIVKMQKSIFEAVLGQRMSMQKYLPKINQLPQHENYQLFRDQNDELFEQLEHSIKDNIASLNEVCKSLGKRLAIDIPTFTSKDDVLKKVEINYGKSMQKWEDLVQKWYARTQFDTNILNKKLNKKNVALSALQQPILTQVCKAMENKQFIETRTHQKRDVYRVLGKPAESLNEKLDFQIYDDNEFYQGLIKGKSNLQFSKLIFMI